MRDGTPATKLPPELTVPEDVAADRMGRLIETVRGMSRARNLQSLGQRYEVLVEKEVERSWGNARRGIVRPLTTP